MEPMNQHTLDSRMTGCGTPGCTAKHENELYMHGRCHPSARVDVALSLDGNVLHVTCVKCDKEIIDVKLLWREFGEIKNFRCHPDAAFDVRYKKGSGEIEVLCAVCQQLTRKFQLAR